MNSPPANPPASRREIIAWAFYDFANSGYTTVVLTTIYSAYFVGVVAAELEAAQPGAATLLWTLAIGAANLIVLFSGPVLGAIADVRASKKRFLLWSSLACIGATALLAGAAPGQVALAAALVTVSAVAFASGENLIAAFLPEIASSDNMGRISGYGWSLGYFGGLLTLGCCLAYINYASGQGLAADHYVPVCLLLTAAIFAVTAAPTFLWLRERARPRPLAMGNSGLRAGLARVKYTLGHARNLPDLFRFLLCIILFQAGVATVVVIAAIYAQEVMQFDSQQLIVLIMVVNLTAAVGAFFFGFMQDRFGSVNSLAGALLVWIVAIAVALRADSDMDIWLAGNLIGLAMGATQAGGRALIGQLTPATHNGEIFGLWGLANRSAAIIGPISYGLINRLGGGDHQLALISTLGFFVGGLALLFTVNEKRGHAAAAAVS
ncbi:MFS transporter [Seongchinamella sediminis]|uniref:MFS transporter n=1 Tax=Seongchinamella sediminis TaxID=2283635 RepID=A0A3L7DZI2_9GAMM|nr:MFS transporter [Seongchinamella sediminis]RLQ22654.1 MFS transporter [Seongchinamella sediminis]